MIGFDEVFLAVFIMVFLVEDAADALYLDFYTVEKTLPKTFLVQCPVARDRARFPVIQKGNLSVFFERQGQLTLFSPSDVCTYFDLSGVVGIKGKHHASDA